MQESTEPTIDRNYRLVFKSRVVDNPHPEHGKKPVRETACEIFIDGANVPSAFGTVRQHVIDQDCKFTGQKRALEKALDNFRAEKEMRRQLWLQFFMRSNTGKKLIGVEGRLEYYGQYENQTKN